MAQDEVPATRRALTDLRRFFRRMHHSTAVDEQTLKDCMIEITGALRDADFPKRTVDAIGKKIEAIIDTAGVSNRGSQIYETIFDELSGILDPKNSAKIQQNRQCSVVMFMGLRGVGKGMICAKYARHHLKQGFKPALVCANTFRIDAFDRLKIAARDDFPVYGSNARDPAKIANEGIAKFRKENHDLIVVDTSGRHKSYPQLFAEITQLAEAVKPNLVIHVLDGRIGKAAIFPALAFKEAFPSGVVIVTNIKDNPKAVGALGAVATAKCPIIVADTGERGKDFEAIEVESFVRRLLENPWLPRKPSGYRYTLRDMYAYYRKEFGFEKRGSRVVLPDLFRRRELEIMMRYLTMMESMTDEELDTSIVSRERAVEIAEESSVELKDVADLIKTYMRKAKMWKALEPCKPV
uniref:signal-recognition-particle GTPase n=1 Tax=Noccaea caerulescens TaxID=107243 RepID=A0A1J3CJE5_NOCCA